MIKVIVLFLFLAFPVFAIDINSASLSELDKIAGIGPAYAKRIIDNRPYSSLDDLLRVNGIGPATLKKIKDQGLACVNCKEATNVVLETPTVIPSGIIIYEIMPSAQGNDALNEYIKIYNKSDTDADISNFILKDSIGKITEYVISSGTIIRAKSYLVFKRSETKISLNNDNDKVVLLSPDKKEIDSLGFEKAQKGSVYTKSGKIDVIKKPEEKIVKSVLPMSLASVKKINSPSYPWATSIFFSLFCATIILSLKHSLSKNR